MGTPGCLLCSLNMDPVEAPPPHQIRCDGCSQTTSSYDVVHYGSMEQGYRQLCSRCFNTEVAQLAGLLGFEDAKFEAVGLADCTGELHEFHFLYPFVRDWSCARRLRASRRESGWLPVPDHRRPEGRSDGAARGINPKRCAAPCRANISQTTHMDRKSRIQEWCVAGLSGTTIVAAASRFS